MEHAVPFSSLDRSGRWTIGLLLAVVVLSVGSIMSELQQVDLLTRISTSDFTMSEVTSNDSRQFAVLVAKLALLVATAVAFLIWFHRAHKNLPALGARELKYTPGWAVGGFFVPLLNLVRPADVMRE